MRTTRHTLTQAATAPLLLLFLLLTAGAALHHGWANYDQTKTLNITGVIRQSTYENPHGMIQLETADKTWTVVLAPPSRMQQRGLTRDMVAVGDTVTVVGYPHRKTADEMRAERIITGDKTTELR